MWSVLKNHQIDLIVLDISDAGRGWLNGSVASCALTRSRDIPVLMLTARTDDSDRILGPGNGADDYLIKPCVARESLARIIKLLYAAPGRCRRTCRSPRRAG